MVFGNFVVFIDRIYRRITIQYYPFQMQKSETFAHFPQKKLTK